VILLAKYFIQIWSRLGQPRRAFGVWMLLVWSLSAVVGICGDEAELPAAAKFEYQLKAGFLFNFARFTEWPTNALGTPDSVRIGVLDDGKVYPIIASELAGKRVGEKTIEVVRCKSVEDLKRCGMVFVTRSQTVRSGELWKTVADLPVLTVGEYDGFAERGGCINFVRQGENIRFEVNLAAAEQAGLKISSKLASVAIIVRSKEGEK
jgi:hypothetical protein